MPVSKKLLAALWLPAIATSTSSFAQDAAGTPELGVVVVTATRQETRASEVLADVTVVEREEIERIGQGTIVDLLMRQPGIQANSSGGPGTSTSFYVRGANADQTKVLVDGMPINSIDLSGSPLRFMPLGNVERIEILRGPAATLYGADAIGGVIHIITRRGQPGLRANAFAGYGSHNTRQLAAGLSGGDEHWRFRVEGNHFATDGISTRRKSYTANKDADDDAYRNTGGAASLSWLPAEGHEFGLSYRTHSGQVKFDSTPWAGTLASGAYDVRTDFTAQQWQVFAKDRFFDDLWKSTLQYGEAIDDQVSHFDGYKAPLWTRTRQLVWQNDVRLPLGELLAAAEWQRQYVRSDDDGMFDDDHSIHNTAFLLGWTAHYGKHAWQVNTRSDQHSRYGHENTYGLSYGYQITSALRLRLGYGTAFKAPSLDQLYNGGYGNPELDAEKSRNREAALVWERGAHTASLTWYHNRLKDLIAWDASVPVTPGNPWGGGYRNIGRADLSGVTLAWRGQFGDWRIGASYDMLDAQAKDANGHWVPLGRRARNSALFSLDKAWGNLTTSVEVAAIGRRYDATYNKAATDKEKLGGYTLVNLTASYDLGHDLRIEGRLNNLFDKKYETVRYYNTEGFTAFVGLRYSPK
ncbi:MAG: TonB-dependent receptor [Candidatus Accumulibacter sp.]|jgi:vitamin B12 transporter|nr:TonB-dependent receptor [Accumulibacter sp.]